KINTVNSKNAASRPKNNHSPLLRPRRRFSPGDPLVRPLEGLLPAAGGGDVRSGAGAQLDLQPLREPGRLCRELGRGRARSGPVLHRVSGGAGLWLVT